MSVQTPRFLFHLCLLFFWIFSGNVTGQNEQDCIGAIPVCDGFYNQTEGYSGTGDVSNEIPNSFSSCLTADANSVWYVFTVENSGLLSFTLSPNGPDSDYDWILFDFSSGSCDDISNDDDYIVSCNSYGDFAFNGPTGISTASGGTGNSNGPGNTNGPPFNQDVAVTTGETYLLYIQDWSGNSEGYTLDFSESTASIFDSDPPTISSVETDCTGEVHVTMSEGITCENLEPNDFLIIDGANEYVPSALLSPCSGAVNSTSEFILLFPPEINFTENETLTLEISQDNGLLSDACGNLIEDLTFDFEFSGDVSFEIETTDPLCGDDNGIIEILNIENALLPVQVSLNNVDQASTLLNNLGAGEYVVSITDDLGCSSEVVTTLSEIPVVTVSAGEDNSICGLNYTLQASTNAAADITWVLPAGISLDNPTSATAEATALTSGTYELEIIAENEDGCTSFDEVEITFSNLSTTNNVAEAICGSSCEGEVTVEADGGILPYLLTLDGNSSTDFTLENMCAGDYTYTISDALGCIISSEFSIDQLDDPVLSSSSAIDETCDGNCDGSIFIEALNTSNISSPSGTFNEDNILENLCIGNHSIILSSPENCQVLFTVSISTSSNLSAELVVPSEPIDPENPEVLIENHSSGNFLTSELFIDDTFIALDSLSTLLVLDNPDGDPLSITLIITDQFGCVDSDQENVEFLIPLEVFIPNAFTPNGDNLNEVFLPVMRGFDPAEYEFSIFNRWGEIVFQTNDPLKGWKGNDGDGIYYVSPGIYHYTLKVKQQFSSVEKQYYGHLTVVR